uniref:Uncharacterized protein n=1 Tax=Rhizophora mucronata TaxID=61149 RepID=A0A2P2QHP3_RHIMU
MATQNSLNSLWRTKQVLHA